MDLCVQRKVFTKWINVFFPEFSETQFYEQVRDARTLVALLSSISNHKFPLLEQELSNRDAMFWVFKTLKETFFINLQETADSILSSDNFKEIHNFLWSMILHFVVSPLTRQLKESSLFDNCELVLLQWCRNLTFGYKEVDITNFSNSWRSGLAFNAILHKHHPRWFEYSLLLGKPGHFNLEHAFQVAEEKLAVSRLLDCKDIDVDHPDHRSIILYLISCLEKLLVVQNSFALPFENVKKHDKVSPPNSPVPPPFHSFSTNFDNFLLISEDTLTWLTEDLNLLSERRQFSGDLEILRDQFHQHETFMLKLTERQDVVGQILMGGIALAKCASVDDHQKQLIERQIDMINKCWEELRTKAMERQNNLHSSLVKEQQMEIETFANHLSSFENKVKALKESSVENGIDQFQILERTLPSLQKEVSSLQSMLLVVDEAGSHLAMENQLEELGKRWLKVSSEIEDLKHFMENLRRQRSAFVMKLGEFKEWLMETEALLNGVLRLETGNGRGFSDENLEHVVQQVKCLKMIENNMEKMVDEFQRLNTLGSEMAKISHDEKLIIDFINRELQSCQERWDILVRNMEALSKDISESGIEIAVVSNEGNDLEGGFEQDFKTSLGNLISIKFLTETLSTKDIDVLKSFQGFKKTDETASDDEISKNVKERTGSLRCKRRTFSEDELKAFKPRRDNFGEKIYNEDTFADIVQRIRISKNGHYLTTFSILKKIPRFDGESPCLSSSHPSEKTKSLKRKSFESLKIDVSKSTFDSMNLKQEFDKQVAALNQWLDQAEVTQEMVSLDSERFDSQLSLNIHEQAVLIEDAEKDVAVHLKHLETLQFTGKFLCQELLKSKKPTEPTIEALKSIERRWDILLKILEKNIKQLKSTRKSHDFLEQLELLKDAVNGYERWVDEQMNVISERDFAQLSRLLEQNRVKMKALQSYEDNIRKLKELLQDSANIDELSEKLEIVEQNFKNTLAKMGSRQASVSRALDCIPSKSFSDSLSGFNHWLDQTESKVSSLSSSLIIINFVEYMEKDSKALEDLLDEVNDKLNHLEYLNHATEEIKGRLSDYELKLNNVCGDIDLLNHRWTHLRDILNSKHERLKTAIEKVTDFQTHCKELTKWLNEMETFLSTEPLPKGNIDLLKAQLNESEGVREDIRTMESSVVSMNEVVENFCSNANSSFARKLRSDQEDLNFRWGKICKLSEKQYEILKSDLVRFESLFSKLNSLDKWIDGTVKVNTAKEYKVSTLAEISSLADHFKILLHEFELQSSIVLCEVEKELEIIKNESEADIDEIDDGNIFHVFNVNKEKFACVRSRISTLLDKFSMAKASHNLLSELLKEERNRLDRLRCQLEKQQNSKSLDAEEFTEELEDLENILSSDNNFEKIMKLSQELMNENMLMDDVNQHLDEYIKDYKHLHREAKAAASKLSDMINESQERENLISDITQWLWDTNEVIREDPSIGEETNYQNMRRDFETRKKTLKDLLRDAQTMRNNGRSDAASKLEGQLQLLSKHYKEVEDNFLYWQRNGLDEKLTKIKGDLEALDLQLKTKLKSFRSEEIQLFINSRMASNHLISGMKSDFETVMRNGKQVVEKKLTQQPLLLTSQLDDLKNLYNAISVKITRDKNDLEELLRIYIESHDAFEYIENLVHDLEIHKECAHLENLDLCQQWIKNKSHEIPGMLEKIISLDSSFKQHSELLEENMLIIQQKKFHDAQETLKELLQTLEDFKLIVMKEEEIVDMKYGEFTEIQNNAIEILKKIEDEYRESKTVDSFLTSREDLLRLLDKCRKLAKEINSRNSKFSHIIDFKVKEVNKQWKHVTGVMEKSGNNVPNESTLCELAKANNPKNSVQVIRGTNDHNSHQELMEEILDFHSVCVELEELNSWINRLELIVEEVERPIDTSAAYLKADFNARANKLNNLEQGLAKQQKLNKELEKKLLEHFSLLRLRLKILESELFKNESSREFETPKPQNYKISFSDESPQNFLNNLESLQKLVELIRKKAEDGNSESEQLFSTLPTQAIADEVRMAEIFYKEAKSRSFAVFGSESVDASLANDALQKIRSCMESLPRKWIEFPIKESVDSIYEEAQRRLTDTKSCLSDPVNVFTKKDLLRAHSESNNVLRALGELRSAWQKISEKLLKSSDTLCYSIGIIEDCNVLTGPLNKAFIKICRRKLKLEKYLSEVEQNKMELADIQSSIDKVQKLFHINNNAMKDENEIIQLMNDALSCSQQSYDHLQAILATAKDESDIIKLLENSDSYDVGSKLSLWVALKNQVRALERLNNVLQVDSVDDSYEPVDSKNFSSNDVSNSESAFATFVSCLASQTSGSSDVDEVVRSFCSSVEVMLQSNRTKIVLCDISTIERTMSALKENMEDVEAKTSEVISRCSEKSDNCSNVEALLSLEEKVRYCKSECDSLALGRKLNLEDILRESNQLNSVFDELMKKMEALERKAMLETTRGNEKGEVSIEPSQTLDIETKFIVEKIHTFKSRAEGAMHQFMHEDNSLLLRNIQFLENRWRSTEFLMNRVSCVRKSSNNEKEAEIDRWVEGLKKELRLIKESNPEDLDGLKSQIEELEALRLKMIKKEASETSAITQQSNRLDEGIKDSQENFQEIVLYFKSMFDQIIGDKTKLLERAKRQQDAINSMNITLKRLNSIISQWKPLLHPTRSQLESELSSIKIVQSEAGSLRAQLEGLSCPSDSERMLISKQIDSQCKDIGSRISTLDKLLVEKTKALKSKLDEICPFSEAQLSMTVSYPWERTLTDGDHPVPYYINHSQEKTQWDHPEISSLFRDIDGMNSIKFSAYRMAMKLRMIRKKLLMDKVLLEDVVSFFKESASLNLTPSSVLSVSDYCYLLSKLLDHLDPNEQLSKDMQESFKAERLSRQQSSEACGASLWIELTLNCLLHLFDSSRKGQIESSCVVTFLVLLSSGSLENKYKALYSATLTDGCTALEHLKKVINNCLQLPKHLGEDRAFSEDSVNLTANNCLEKTGSRDEISLESFITWMKMEPQPLAWIGVHERLCAAEDAVHYRRCNVCKRNPIVGLRYRCLKCFNFDLCQDCFFHGLSGEKGHKISHPMQEYYTTTSSGENMRCLTKMFRNKLRSKRYFKTHLKLGYLPVLDATKSSTLTRTLGYNTLERSEFNEIRDGKTKVDIENQPPISRSLSVDDIGHRFSCSDDEYSRNNDSGNDSGWKKRKTTDLSIKKNQLENKVNKEAQCILSALSFRLAQVENRKECVAPNWSDEHNLIAQYCRCLREGKSMKYLLSPIEILVGVEADYKNELETTIRELKEESRLLQKEYNDLKRAQMKSQQSMSSVLNKSDPQSKNRNSDDVLSSTPRYGKLERIDKKMRTIEQQNIRLEEQLKQLKKMLLDECKMGPSNLLSHDLNLQMSDCNTVKSTALPPSFELASMKSPIKASDKKRNPSKERHSFPESQLKKSSADKFTQVTCKLHEKKSS